MAIAEFFTHNSLTVFSSIKIEQREFRVRFEKLGEVIERAKSHEENTGQLSRHLQKVTAGLHSSVTVKSKQHSPAALTNFVIKYIEHAPKFLSVMAKASAEASMLGLTLPIIKVSEDFFLNPPEILGREESLERLMESAYLIHRLIEEVNDRFLLETGKALVPVDMITANLIIHNLIGEPFSNQLDDFCFELAKEVIQASDSQGEPSPEALISDEKQMAWTKAWLHWSEILEESHVGLRL